MVEPFEFTLYYRHRYTSSRAFCVDSSRGHSRATVVRAAPSYVYVSAVAAHGCIAADDCKRLLDGITGGVLIHEW
jgi:hypothetical protein